MKKRGAAYFLAVVLGLLATLFVFWNTTTSNMTYDESYASACTSVAGGTILDLQYAVVDATTVDSGGFPLKYEKVTATKVHPCIEEVGNIDTFAEKKNLQKEYLVVWQFYADWAILSLPFIGGAYLYGRRTREK